MRQFSKIENIIFLSIACWVVFVFSSCLLPDEYPPEPGIKFESYSYKDTLNELDMPVHAGILKFSFTDGDGDIGLNDGDTLPPYSDCKDSTCNNVYINRIGINNGNLSELLSFDYRIPDITPAGQNKTLKGEIEVELDIRLPVIIITDDYDTITYDTVIYEVYIYDRALNQSNIITTPSIVLNN
ncbi:MAG: hypothetical protein ABII90_00165 [Bacteroidota bacterium]